MSMSMSVYAGEEAGRGGVVWYPARHQFQHCPQDKLRRLCLRCPSRAPIIAFVVKRARRGVGNCGLWPMAVSIL